MNRRSKGFTLAELLIVVAIIAVLVAIAIPIFTSQLEKSRESTDLANVRSAYAEVMAAATTEDKRSAGNVKYSNGSWSASVQLKQQQDGWQMSLPITIAGVESESNNNSTAPDRIHWTGKPVKNGICTVNYSEVVGVSFVWSGDRAVANVLLSVVNNRGYARLKTSVPMQTKQTDVFGKDVEQRALLGDDIYQVLCAQDTSNPSPLANAITNSLINKNPTVNGQAIDWNTTKVNYVTMKLGANGPIGDVLGYQLIQTNSDGTYNAYTLGTDGSMTVEMNKTEHQLKASSTAYKGNQ